jgi:hypothetical protein
VGTLRGAGTRASVQGVEAVSDIGYDKTLGNPVSGEDATRAAAAEELEVAGGSVQGVWEGVNNGVSHFGGYIVALEESKSWMEQGRSVAFSEEESDIQVRFQKGCHNRSRPSYFGPAVQRQRGRKSSS